MDCEKIRKRNSETIKELLEKYNIKETLDDLLNYFTSVYTHKDFKQKRVRLLGIKEEYIKDNNGESHSTGKKKTVQLYVLSKRMIQTLPENTVYEISQDLATIAIYFEQLKLLRKIELIENEFETFIHWHKLTIEDYKRMKD